MKFEWDDAKDRSNQVKHGVSFVEAQRVFECSDDYLEIFDAEHSETEDRFMSLDQSIVESWLSFARSEKKTSSGLSAPD